MRWDDGWARLKALSSSLGREVPNAAGVFVPDSEIYSTQKINDKISEMCYKLTDIYKSHGLATTTLESYLDVMRELEKKLMDEEMVVEEKDVNKYHHFTWERIELERCDTTSYLHTPWSKQEMSPLEPHTTQTLRAGQTCCQRLNCVCFLVEIPQIIIDRYGFIHVEHCWIMTCWCFEMMNE